jgi:hypothetical protein
MIPSSCLHRWKCFAVGLLRFYHPF